MLWVVLDGLTEVKLRLLPTQQRPQVIVRHRMAWGQPTTKVKRSVGVFLTTVDSPDGITVKLYGFLTTPTVLQKVGVVEMNFGIIRNSFEC